MLNFGFETRPEGLCFEILRKCEVMSKNALNGTAVQHKQPKYQKIPLVMRSWLTENCLPESEPFEILFI
jgi:hypothetical protein